MKKPASAAGKNSKGCPICGKPRVEKYAPFCSARCADVDLYRWLKGSYVVPGKPVDDIGDDDGEAARPTRGQPDDED